MADSGGITPPGTESHAGSGQDKTKAKATEGTSQTANLPPPDQTASGSSSAKNPPGQSRDGPSKLADSASGSVQKDPGKKKNKDREENRGLTEKKQGMFVIDKRQEYKPKYCSSEQKKTEHIKEKLLKVKSTQTEIKKDDSEAETIADKPDNKTEKLEVVTDGKQNLDEEHRSDEQVAKQNKDQHFSGTDGQQAQTSHTDTYRKTKEESEGLEILDLGSSFVLVSHNQSAEIPINVKTLTGKVIRINAKLTDTIGKVMEKIKDKEGIAADVQRLIFDGKQLEENHTLLEYSIGKGSTIHLVVSRKTGMQIYVTKPNKEKILLDVQRNYSVAKIKAMIKDESDIFAENWCLRFGKEKLEDENKTLADYSILHGSSLIVFLPRKTGKTHQNVERKGVSTLEGQELETGCNIQPGEPQTKGAQDKPSAPKDLTVCDITSGSCKPCWGKPENDGGSSIIEYIVQWREANAEKWTESTCSATECMIKSLKESTQYIFRVAAKNIIGTGEFTAHIELETKWSYKCNGSMNIKSGKPMFLEMKFKGQKPHESYIHCLFNGSEHPNKNRTNIEITDSKIIFKLENVVLSDKGEYILTAENKTGSGAVSAILYVIDKPSAPKSLTISDITSESCHLHWQKPDHENGSRITKYIVQMCENSEKNWKEFGSCTTTDIVVNELQRKTQYRFRIAAENKVGTGAFVELPVPIATEDILEWDYHDENTVKVKCGDSTVLQVPFKGAKPSVFLLHNDGPIQNMERISAETKDSCVYCHLHEVDHADQGKYTLTVENDTGRGTVVTTLTVLDKPSAPKKLTISDITSESCHLHWQKPDYENGSRITKYIVQICENRKMDWKEAGSSTNTDIVVNELQRKTQYRFRVAAENKVGIGAFGELSAPITTEDISGESQQTDNDTHPESGSPLSRSSNFERLLDEDQGETNFDEKNASVQFQMSSMTYTADDDWKELEYDKESSSVKVLDKKTDTGVANGKVKHNTHSVKDKEENKMESEGFFNKESQKSVPQKSLEYTLVKVGNNYILHSQIHEPVKISQITGELNVSVEDEYILIDGEIVYSISYESGQIMISKVEEAQFEIIKENQECSPSSITNDHHNEELIPCQREVKFNKNENLDSDIEKLTDGIKEFRIKDYQSRDSQNRYMEPTEDKNKECYVLVKNVPKGCSSESLWRDMIEPGFPVVPPLLIYHPKEKDALLICNSEADAAKLCRLGKFDVFEFEPHELCLHDPMITVDRAWLQLLASQQKYDEFVKKMKDIHVHVCTNGTVQAGTTYQLKVVKHIISDWKSLDITCKTIDNVSDNIWNVVSLVKQAHIGEFTANGGNIEFKNGKIHLSASNKDLLSDIFSVLQTYVNSLSKRVFLELPVNPEKKFPEENIKKWCSEIEEELEQECCVYNPKTNLVLAFCNTYENNMKVKYLLRVKKGEIKSTARGRRFTKESKNQEEPVETNKKILPVRDDVRERDFFQTKEGVKVYVCVADILNLDVDCIVNAANDRLQHGGGVAAAIQCGAGYALKKASRDYISKHGKLKAGEACTTTAGDLKYDCVIHAVGPCWSDYYPHNVEKVRECGMDLMDAVTNSFLEAEHHNLKSIALPAISSAIFGVPEKLCIYHYVKATVLYSRSYASKSKALKEIHFVDRNKDTIAKIRNMFEDWLGETASPPDFDINQFISKESGRSANSKKHEKSLHEKKNFPEVSSYLPTPLSYEEKWMTYAYIFCGVDDQKIVATIGNIFDSKASAVVVTINELGEYGTLGKQIFKKVNMSQASEYRRQLSNGLRVNKYLGGIIRTHGFDCGFNFIIHAVFPYYTRRNTLEQRQMDIQKTYWNIFCTAYLDKDISSVVLPLIGIEKSQEETKMCAGCVLNAYIRFCKERLTRDPRPFEVSVVCKDVESFDVLKTVFDKYVMEVRIAEEVSSGTDKTTSLGATIC